MNKVLITGLGVVSSVGTGRARFCQSLGEGQIGAERIARFASEGLPITIGAPVKDFSVTDYLPPNAARKMGRAGHLAVAAAQLALADACLVLDDQQRQTCPVFVGTALGGMDVAEDQMSKLSSEGAARMSPYTAVALGASVSSSISAALSLHGASICLSDGCCSATDAIAYAMNHVRSGLADIAFCGGVEACLTKAVVSAFNRLGVMSTACEDKPQYACRPFHRHRDGIVLGEGAWILVLESEAAVSARKAKAYAELAGFGSTCDAYHPSSPHPSGAYSVQAIRAALRNAQLSPEDIDCISAYGNGTRMNDPLETRIYKEVFNGRASRIPISSIKPMIGHPVGASGAAQVAASALAINEGFIPPTMNLDDPDPECDLDYVPNRSRTQPVNNVLVNTLSFGGKNSCLILRKIESDRSQDE